MAQRPTFSLSYPGIQELLRDLEGKLAKNGLKFKSGRSVLIGDEVSLLVRVPEDPEPVTLLGEVSWISPEEDPQGKRVVLVRNLRLSEDSHQRVQSLKRKPPTPAPERIVPAEIEAFPVPEDRSDRREAPPQRKRSLLWLWISLGVMVLLGGVALWLSLGGLRWIQMNLLAPPSLVHLPPPSLSLLAPEPELPAPTLPPPPPPKKPAPLLLVDFEYYQKPGENEFIFIFNRPFREVNRFPGDGPSQVVLFVPGGRFRLDNEQQFFPFTFVQSVLFEEAEDGSGLRISFFGRNPDYIPPPVWEINGRELRVVFRENP